MRDAAGRTIDYMRISLTDRCNLRCRYCMPEDVQSIPHASILRYEEILAICDAAGELGVRKFKVTGGEPFVRKDASLFISRLSSRPYAEAVTVTTNGLLLEENLPELADAGISGINISLDAVSAERFRSITGTDAADRVLRAVEAAAATGIPVKTNTVLLKENEDEWTRIARLAERLPVAVRFIECMPSACAGSLGAQNGPETLLRRLRGRYPDLRPAAVHLGNGPAHYYESEALEGYIGLIAASSQPFCDRCNRIRLTASGRLIACLGGPDGTDLRAPLRDGADKEELRRLIAQTVYRKPGGHRFDAGKGLHAAMHAIGG